MADEYTELARRTREAMFAALADEGATLAERKMRGEIAVLAAAIRGAVEAERARRAEHE